VHYTAEDYFGAWSAMRGHAIHNFVADEETICYVLPVKVLMDLVYRNGNFGGFFNKNLSLHQSVVTQQNDTLNMTEIMLAKVDSSCMREPLVLEQGVNLQTATRYMREQRVDCCLVKRGQRYGMVTRSDLLNAIVLEHTSPTEVLESIANFRLITVEVEDYLFNALIQMTQYHIGRVVVVQGSALKGIIELTDALSYFSSHSHVVGLRIERAQSIHELQAVSDDMTDLIRSLYFQGVKIRFAMDLLAALNKRLLGKLFNLMVPESVLPHVCLVVMGSEGRGEQILKTDQDNGLIMRDGLHWPECQQVMEQFSRTLINLGFPPCKGRVMVNNPYWVMPLSKWTQRMHNWVQHPNEQTLMNYLLVSAFARPALAFWTPLTLLGSIRGKADGIDIKKGGIFPIVHGIRVMALHHQVSTNNTFRRIEALVAGSNLPRRMGNELIESFAYLNQLRLKQQLQRMEQADVNSMQKISDEYGANLVKLDQMDRLDKDLLRQSLQVVKEFKQHLTLRYRLSVML
jgi:CBS domain-containing protein